MFLTHNVVNVSWPERALTDDLSRDTNASPPTRCLRLEPHGKNSPQWNPAHAWGSHSSLCVQFVLSVKWGTRTRTEHDIPEIAWSNLITSFFPPSPVSLRPSSSLRSQTERLLRTDSLADGKTDKLACRQTDTQGCAVLQSLTPLPHSESAFLNMNSVPWIQRPVSYSVRLFSNALVSLQYD